MTLKHQKDIRLINNCDAIYDEDLLKKAILLRVLNLKYIFRDTIKGENHLLMPLGRQ